MSVITAAVHTLAKRYRCCHIVCSYLNYHQKQIFVRNLTSSSIDKQLKCRYHSPTSGNSVSSRHGTVKQAVRFDANDYIQHEDCSDNKEKMPLIEETFNDIMKTAKRLSNKEWDVIGQRFQNDHLQVIWPTVLLSYMSSKKVAVPALYDVGMSLVDYVAEVLPQHIAVRLTCTVALCVHQGGPSQHAEAFAAFDALLSLFQCLDYVSVSVLIPALSKTNRWKICLDLINMVKEMNQLKVSTALYSPVLVAAMKNGDQLVVKTILQTLYESDSQPSDESLLDLINDGHVIDVMEVLENYRFIPGKTVAHSIVRYFERLSRLENWQACETSVDRRGCCRNCDKYLKRLPQLSADEFAEMRKVFLEKALKRDGNIFLHSTPEELERFNVFLHQNTTVPFDVVLDGLNIAYATYQKASQQEKERVLFEVIRYFTERKKRVLVLGRSYMSKWKYLRDSNVLNNDNIVHYYTDNQSYDDPYMLYAALHSGPQTYIVTRDQLRDHRRLVGPKLAERMKLWQRARQIRFEGIFPKSKSQQKLAFQWPDVHSTAFQKTQTSVHIPFVTSDLLVPSYVRTKTWYCITQRNTSPPSGN